MMNTKKFYAGIYNSRFEFTDKVMSIRDKEYKMWKFLYILIGEFETKDQAEKRFEEIKASKKDFSEFLKNHFFCVLDGKKIPTLEMI